MNILCFVGGISSGSINRKLYQSLERLKPEGWRVEAFEIENLPFFSQDLEAEPPQAVVEMRSQIQEADGILFVTPEYNRSFPGVLKNAIDWGSRPYGKNSFDAKPAAVLGGSVGNIGTFGAQHHLRQVLAYLNMRTMGQPESYLNLSQAFDESGALKDEKIKKILQNFWQAYSHWVGEIREKAKAA